MDLISIIIPVYNVEEYISDCIESVLKQTYNNIEVIIVDDGSTDNSKEIALSYSIKDNRVKVLSQKNMGASVARNRGIEESTGKFIMFFDSDDILEKNGIDILYNEIIKNNCDISIGDWINIDENNNLLGSHDMKNKELFKKSKLYSNKEILLFSFFDPVPSNKLFKKEIISKYKLKFAEVAIGQDLNFFLKYIIHCDKVKLINKRIFKYRIRSGSISRTYSIKILEIIKSFEDIQKYYINNGKFEEYKNELYSWKVHHLNWQINKIRLMDKIEDRKKIISEFKKNTKDISRKNMINNIEKSNFIKLKIKYLLQGIYSSNIYCKIYISMNTK